VTASKPQPTLIEALEPLRKATHRDRILVAMAWEADCRGEPSLTVAGIRELLVSARVKNAGRMNISDVLTRAGSLVDRSPNSGSWSLTQTGRDHLLREFSIDQLVETSSVSAVEPSLRAQMRTVTDEVARSFVEEAITCFEANALRAAVVFLWSGAMRALEDSALASTSGVAMTAAIRRHDPKCSQVHRIEDFAQIKDRFALLGFRELGLLDKGEWSTLQEALDLRNRCGHPTKYRPGISKARAYVEDVVGIAF
jgi:hypothetical protein